MYMKSKQQLCIVMHSFTLWLLLLRFEEDAIYVAYEWLKTMLFSLSPAKIKHI